jgi:glycosyltransferase involved in cell wall biosynthesis
VIPTRNRAYTLYYTLKTCLNQYGFDDYEIVVSDNCSEDNTTEMIKDLNSEKIKYFKTDCVLAMTDNFNFAISKTIGEYVLFIGSDDAIHTHGLYLLNRIIEITGEKIIAGYNSNYWWSDCVSSHKRNIFNTRMNSTSAILDAKNNVKKIVCSSSGHLPNLYGSCVVHRNLIHELINRTGMVFDSVYPDYYSGFALSALINQYIWLQICICVGGVSDKSNGESLKVGKSSPIIDEFVKLQATRTRNKTLKGKFFAAGIITTYEGIVIDDFNCAKKNLNAFSNIDVDIDNLLKSILYERYTANMYLGNIGKDIFLKELDIIQNVIENTPEYKANFSGKGLNIDDYEFYEPIDARIPKVENGVLQFDASLFGIDNIYDVTLFAEKLLYSKEYIDAYLNQFERNWNKSKSNFEWLNKYDKIGIFATGKYTEQFLGLYTYFKTKDIDIILFDNDKTKWESGFYDHKVLSPEKIPEQKLDILIISSQKFQDEIYESVKKYEQTIEIIKLYDKFGWNFAPSFVFI